MLTRNWRDCKLSARNARLATELLQKRVNFLSGWRREVKYGLNVNVRKTEPRETRSECLTDVLGGGARHFYKRSENRFVFGLRKFVGGEAIEDFGALLLIERRRAKRCEEPPFDFGDRQKRLRFVH